MSDTIISVENLSKRFVISHEETERYSSLRDAITNNVRNLFSRRKEKKSTSQEEFWALNDLNFEINRGDRVGIIGRNGAGKSTLLKILSRITEPTKGKISINGRVASLLEVGTGFHPELTGRENIFLNGAILGMSRSEIRSKFDEIVDFAEVEQFLDTPVKRYSSGMYVRLAFAVAAHLEPEILIVDEVLAVGDAQFQRKCLGKMRDVSKGGRTVLFVSHNMGTISQLCNKAILLNKGHLISFGDTDRIIDQYINDSANRIEIIERTEESASNHFKLLRMCDENLTDRNEYRFDEPVSVMVKLSLPKRNYDLELAMRLVDRQKRAVFTIHQNLSEFYSDEDIMSLLVTVPKEFLTPGIYSWVVCINHPGVDLYDLQDDVLPFTIVETGSDFARYSGAEYGSIFAQYKINKI
jgi:lipopolysaccharide transport system ATP-binding protein